MRVYRFETDDGERVIGRLVTPKALDRFYQGLGVNGAPALSHQEAWSAVLERGACSISPAICRSAAHS
jgi:hypothetical protein